MLGLFFLSLIGLTFVFDSDDASDETSDDTADTSETSETDVEIVPLDVVLADGDSQSGTGGDDTFSGGDLENVFVAAGAGDDLIESSGANDNVTIEGGAGDDTITGPTGADYTARANYDGSQIDGGAGDDLVENLNGDVTILGGEGDDIVRNVDVSLIDGGNGDDLLEELNANRILGGEGDDVIRRVNANFVDGGNGDDVIFNRGYFDRVEGGAGDDTISNYGFTFAGEGNDVVYSPGGFEVTDQNLGLGDDQFVVQVNPQNGGPDGEIWHLVTTGAGADSILVEFENTGYIYNQIVNEAAENGQTLDPGFYERTSRLVSVVDFEPGVDQLVVNTNVSGSTGNEFDSFDIEETSGGNTIVYLIYNSPTAGVTIGLNVELRDTTGVTANDIQIIDATASS